VGPGVQTGTTPQRLPVWLNQPRGAEHPRLRQATGGTLADRRLAIIAEDVVL
jgi:hypothetical protein